MSIRRSTLVTLASLAAFNGALGYAAHPAAGAVKHELLTRILRVPTQGPKGEAIARSGPIEQPQAMTVDESELYVVDGPPGNVRVDRFDASSGAFKSQFLPEIPSSSPPLAYTRQGIAIGRGTGETEIYIGTDAYPSGGPEGAVAVFDAAGELQAVWSGADTPAGSFGCFECGGPGDVAVDNSTSISDWAAGDVYVAVPLRGVVDVFKPEAGGKEKYVTELRGPETGVPFAGEPVSVAVDQANGDLLVAAGDAVYVFEPAALGEYNLVRELTSTPAGPFTRAHEIAIDATSGDIYLAESETGTVTEFSATGEYLGLMHETPVGPVSGVGPRGGGLAVDSATDHLFAGVRYPQGEPEETEYVDIFGAGIVIPDVTTAAATNVGPTDATLNGTVNPDGAGAASCQFEWGRGGSLSNVAPCAQTVANGAGAVSVHAVLEGLEPDTTYSYRLRASNTNGANVDEALPKHEFTTTGPGLREASVTDVTASSATLHAAIDPHGTATAYYFQYGTSEGYGAEVPAAGPAGEPIGSGEADVEVGQHLQDLSAGTVYHYRLVVVSELVGGSPRTFDGPDQTFTTQGASGETTVADGRKWEMVSPPNKEGASLEPITEQDGLIEAAAAGGAFTYIANIPTEPEPQGNADTVQVFATRGPGGWVSRDIALPHREATGKPVGNGPEYRFFSSDLSLAAVEPLGQLDPELSPEASEQTTFLRTDYQNGEVGDPCRSSCYRPLVTGAPGYANVPPGTVFSREGCLIRCGPDFVGATPDLSHIILQSSAGLTPGAGSNGGLYEWAAGRLTFVGSGQIGDQDEAAKGAISSDGSRVVMEGTAEGIEGLLLRDLAKGQTVKLDAIQGGRGGGVPRATFQAASTNGTRVFFTDETRLTADAGAAYGEEDLYVCEIAEVAGRLQCNLTDLTPLGPHGERALVQGGVLGTSEDGSWVYFVANGALAPGATRGGCGAGVEATCNLYVLHRGASGWESPRFIAALSAEDAHDWSTGASGQPTRVSPDGRWLAFMSQQPLAGYDNRDVASGRPVAEVYLYNADTGHLACASCDPTGARPTGVPYKQLEAGESALAGGTGAWATNGLVAANVPGWQQTAISGSPEHYQSRYLSDSGRLFFNSDDALVPQDVNGTEDVYEYEPPGIGSCATALATFDERSGGCVGLISSGASAEESAFLDAGEDGGDVFFLTGARLAPQDYDTSLDIYDAHECTQAVPCLGALATPPVCSTGDACKSAPTPQPSIYGVPSSATFSGAGNVAASAPPAAASHRSLSRTQRLARALKACAKRRGTRRRGPRAACERAARKRYRANASRRRQGTKARRAASRIVTAVRVGQGQVTAAQTTNRSGR